MRLAFFTCLLGGMVACGGSDQTCLRVTLTYAGVHDAPVWIKTTFGDSGFSLSNYPSVRDALCFQPTNQLAGVDLCWGPAKGAAESSTTTAWLDIENAAAASCSLPSLGSPLGPSCAPTAQDPQGTTVALLHAHEVNVVQVDIRDP